MNKKFQYGKNEKKIVFADSDKRHADLRLKLRRDGLTQLSFFKSIVTGYLEDNENIVAYIDSVKHGLAKAGKKKIDRRTKDMEYGASILKDFGLSDEDRKFIFDSIEKGEES